MFTKGQNMMGFCTLMMGCVPSGLTHKLAYLEHAGTPHCTVVWVAEVKQMVLGRWCAWCGGLSGEPAAMLSHQAAFFNSSFVERVLCCGVWGLGIAKLSITGF